MKNTSGKVGRNDPCPCGSGLKFKKCCQRKGETLQDRRRKNLLNKHQIRIKQACDIEGIRRTGHLVVETLAKVEEMIEPGITTEDINRLVHDFTIKNRARPAPLNYKGYPKSVCTSVNQEICHGIPCSQPLFDGDIVNVDVTSVLNGYFADASKTFLVGTPGPDAEKIVDVARECLDRGIAMAQPGNTVGDIGWAIQEYAEGEGCSVVREFVGHGVGLEFHEGPQVPHFGKRSKGVGLFPGMVFTIEPMINLGGADLYILDNEWTAVTQDGSLSAQFEKTVLITETGLEILTPWK